MEWEISLAEGMLFTSPSPLPTSFWMATGCLLPVEGSSPMTVLHSAALEGV